MTNVVQFSGTNEDLRARARKLTDAIKTTAEHFVELLGQAYTQKAWEVLQYPDWDTYCKAEFAGIFKLALAGDDRSEMFGQLQDHGMTYREIASATGVHYSTVSRSFVANATDDHEPGDHDTEPGEPGDTASDLPVSDPESAVDEWDEDAGQDDTGEAYAEPDEDAVIDAEIVDEGDQDKAQAPAAMLIDRTDKIVGQIDRLTDQLEKLAADKRWSGERRKILARMKVSLGQLQSALDVVHAK